jgi:ABC-type branched-subunit amino acid transport system substrate-binding protein
VFRSEPSADLMVQRVVADMVANGVKTVGFIGFSDSWGEVLHKALTKAAEARSPSSPPSATAAPTPACRPRCSS